MSGDGSELDQKVRSLFAVKEQFLLPGGDLEYQVAYDSQTRLRFEKMAGELQAKGYRSELTGTKDECVLTIKKEEQPPAKLSRIPVILALLTLSSLVVFSLLQRLAYELEAPSLTAYFVFFATSLSIALLLGVHELGQRISAKRGGGRASSYPIPGVPLLLPPYLPSLGFVSSIRKPALNRDRLFDTVIAGPLAIFLVAVVLYVVGDMTSVPSPVLYQWAHAANANNLTNPNAIENSIDWLLGPALPKMPTNALPVSPIADGATVGFIIVFMSLLPMATFDGGFLALAAWGPRAARVTTYLSALGLLALDTPFYWSLAIVVLLLAGRPYQLKLLDEVSGLSPSRQWVFIGALVVAFLCIPIPHNFANLPLP